MTCSEYPTMELGIVKRILDEKHDKIMALQQEIIDLRSRLRYYEERYRDSINETYHGWDS